MNRFAAAPIEIILHAEPLFKVGGITITNSMLLGWIVTIFLISMFIRTARRMQLETTSKPFVLFEIISEGITNLAASVMHDRKRATKYAPFLITLFCFILFNNWFGLLPGVGTIKLGHFPLFRAWTSDLTGTLALAVSSIVTIQIYAIRELGVIGHIKHYFSNKPWNPINFFIGILEVLGEFTRMASLSLRLFGNVFAGEVLLIVLSAITSFGSPIATLPFILMEFFVGFIQAFVFVTLVIVYLTLATTNHDESHDSNNDHSQPAALKTEVLRLKDDMI